MISLFCIVLIANSVLCRLQLYIFRSTGKLSGAAGMPVVLGFMSVGILGWAVTEAGPRSSLSMLLLVVAYLLGFAVAGLLELLGKKKAKDIE